MRAVSMSSIEELERDLADEEERRRDDVLIPLERELETLRTRAAEAAHKAPLARAKAEKARTNLEEEKERAKRVEKELLLRQEWMDAKRQQRQTREEGGEENEKSIESKNAEEQLRRVEKDLLRVCTSASREEEKLREVVAAARAKMKNV